MRGPDRGVGQFYQESTVHGALLIAVLGRIRLHPNRRGAGFRGDNFEVKQLRDGGRVAHMAREFDRHASTVNA